MNIIKSLHSGLLHKTFCCRKKNIFSVSLLWGFDLITGIPVLEQKLWSSIGELLGKNEIFDAGMPKSQGEALVHGSFFAPGGKTVEAGKVSLTIGPVHKELAVSGDRQWRRGLGALAGIKGPDLFTEMPVTYANAFGGNEFDNNPTGKGAAPVSSGEDTVHPLPNIEYLNNLIGSPEDRPEPASFSPVDIMWKSRLAKAGTYDEKYIRECMPGLPDDIDFSYFNDAAPDQWLDGFFAGDESFTIANMNPDHPMIQGKLPGVLGRSFVNHQVDGQIVFKEIKTKLDTVWFFPKDNLGVLIHRGTIVVAEDDGCDIKQLLIAHETLSDIPRSREHYQTELTRRIDPDEGFKYMMYSTPLIPEGCRCGFEIIKDEAGFPLELSGRKNMETFAENKEKEFKEKIDEQIKIMDEQMFEACADNKELQKTLETLKQAKEGKVEEPPEAKKIKELIEAIMPGVNNDPKNLDITKLNMDGFDDLKAYTEKLAEEKQLEAEELMKKELRKLKEVETNEEVAKMMAGLEQDFTASPKPPPLPRVDIEEALAVMEREYRQQLGPQLMQLRSMGLQGVQIPEMDFDFDEIRKQMEDASVKVKEGYKMGAHLVPVMSSPHEGKEKEILPALLLSFKNGEKTADGDYAYVDFSGQDMSGIDLSGAYLEYADFTNTNLSGANLENAILAKAKLINTNLCKASLAGANIGATVINGANFSGANMTNVKLGKAVIKNAKFHNCTITEGIDTFLETSFEKVDFSGAILTKNTFLEADLTECCFKGSDLTEAVFVKPKIERADFSGAILKGVNFVEARAEKARFDLAQAKNVRFVGGCQLNSASFKGADLSEANLRECSLERTDFSEAILLQTDFGGSNLKSAKFDKAQAIRAQFMKSDLEKASMRGMNLMEGSLMKARLVSADLRDSNLFSVNFMGSVLGDTDFSDAYLEQTILKEWRPMK